MLPDLPVEYYELNNEIAFLDKNLKHLLLKVDTMESIINSVHDSLNDTHHSLLAEILNLEQIEQSMLVQLREKVKNSNNPESAISDFMDFTEKYINSKNKKVPIKINSKIKKLCKKLFGKIAFKCHGDYTDDIYFKHLFLAAKGARDVYDLILLEEIWALVKGKTKKDLTFIIESLFNRLNRLYEKRNILKEQLITTKEKKDLLEHSENLEFAKKYIQGGQVDKLKIEKQHRLNIANKKKALQLSISTLKSKIHTFC